ncbi:MAG TPA: DinB family protein [Candidatus Acidoferrales bacterium]|nr:DinB family protein [Candidatus Acidoferrales bacterium]
MQETAEEYRNRLLSYSQENDPLKLQADAPKRIAKLLAGASSKKLSAKPAPGKWSVNEILAHLADAELTIGYRMRTIAGSPGTPIQAYDQDAWAKALSYEKRRAKESLAAFRAIRESNLAMIRSLNSDQWEHFGMHAERGKESIRTMVSMTAGHDINHIRQIEAILKPQSKKATA